MSPTAVSIRDVCAAPGARAFDFLSIGETPIDLIQMPVVIINGARPGPKLCLTAGVHAAEYPAIDAVMRVASELDPSELAGTVIAVPVVNLSMFQRRSGFLSPIDGLNLNRTAPGNPNGTISERLVHTLLNDVVSMCDYHIDCHGGDVGEILWPYAGYALTGDADLDQRGEAIARLYSPHIVALYREGSTLPPTAGSVTYQATRRGVVSILAEAGSNGALDPVDAEIHRSGIYNVLRHLDMLPGEPADSETKVLAVDQFVVSAQRGGLLRLKIEIGEALTEGQEVAEICNVFGETVERIYMPRAGIARLIWSAKAVNTGDPIVKCWII